MAGRKPLSELKKELRLFISTRTYNEIYLLLLDPMTGKPRYGAVSKVGEKLFRDWIIEVKTHGLPNFLLEN